MQIDDYARLKTFLSSRKEWFCNWRTPKEVFDELDLINRTIRLDYSFQRAAFVTHREAKPLREIWVLAKCAALMSIPEIKLNIKDPPDGYVSRSGNAVPAEVLEVLEPSRKRNQEFSAEAEGISMDPVENWVRRADAIPGALKNGIEQKKAKAYPKSTELFVYLNIGEYGIRQKETEAFIRCLLTRPIAPFGAIHVRWKEKVFSDCGAIFVDQNALSDEEGDDEPLWESVFEDGDD